MEILNFGCRGCFIGDLVGVCSPFRCDGRMVWSTLVDYALLLIAAMAEREEEMAVLHNVVGQLQLDQLAPSGGILVVKDETVELRDERLARLQLGTLLQCMHRE